MASQLFEVGHYEVKLWRGSSSTAYIPAKIVCRSVDKLSYLSINFVSPEGKTYDNACSGNARRGYMYLPVEQYSWYIDLLRNEKPVRVLLSEEQPEGIGLYTGPEPVGEEEAKETIPEAEVPPAPEAEVPPAPEVEVPPPPEIVVKPPQPPEVTIT